MKKTANTKATDDLIKAFLALKTADECKRFLSDICTPKEVSDLSERWQIARLLDAGKLSYREIHAETGVSVTTIGRVARFLQQENYQGYRLVIDRLKKKS
ncbi:MAG: YerC/YecD family TrpR-related protein [Alphaproteobacteria bacterium]|nr:YerC/YecD family TrpR-related protein [Alphaproteobacteria bacterium]